ncbi:MAG TPA: hypothetical protein PKI60_00895 [Oscillospiraceae bacterium]|nr:hypothetical protein [Oscillospiraceae bacterium]
MECKDWILLLVPIILNGLMVYIVQILFQSYNKKQMDSYEKKKSINSTFYEVLLNSKNAFRTFGYAVTDTPDDEDKISNALGEFFRSITKILDYYDDHNYFLENYKEKISEIRNYFNNFIDNNRNKATFTVTESKSIMECVKTLHSYVDALIDASQKNI